MRSPEESPEENQEEVRKRIPNEPEISRPSAIVAKKKTSKDTGRRRRQSSGEAINYRIRPTRKGAIADNQRRAGGVELYRAFCGPDSFLKEYFLDFMRFLFYLFIISLLDPYFPVYFS